MSPEPNAPQPGELRGLLALAISIWVPLVALDTLNSTSLNEIVDSPTLFRCFLIALAVSLWLGGWIVALVAFLGIRFEPLPRIAGFAHLLRSLVVFSSTACLAFSEPLGVLVGDLSWLPAAVLGVVLLPALSTLVVIGAISLAHAVMPPALFERCLAATGRLLPLLWPLLVYREIETTHSSAGLAILALGSVGIAFLTWTRQLGPIAKWRIGVALVCAALCC